MTDYHNSPEYRDWEQWMADNNPVVAVCSDNVSPHADAVSRVGFAHMDAVLSSNDEFDKWQAANEMCRIREEEFEWELHREAMDEDKV